jgi:hypothetical protein
MLVAAMAIDPSVVKEKLQSMAFVLDDMMFNCSFGGVPCSPINFTTTFDFWFGKLVAHDLHIPLNTFIVVAGWEQ